MPISSPLQPIQPSDLHPWQKYMPSKKIRIVIGILAAAGLLYAFHTPLINLGTALINGKPILHPPLPAPIVESPKSALSIDRDIDGDGLPDWQEVLIGTDPNVITTLDEVPQTVRDLVNIPGTIQTNDKLALAIYQRATTDPIGDTVEEQVAAATTKEFLDLADSMDKQLTTYTYEDLNVVDESAESNTTYKIRFTTFIKKISLGTEAFKKIYTAVLQGQSIDQTFSGSFTLTNINELLDMPIPVRTAEQHLVFTNAFAHAYETLQKIASEKDMDEASHYASLLVFQKNLNLMQDVSVGINRIISQ